MEIGIAMRCVLSQYLEVKDLLVDNGFIVRVVNDFEKYPYLCVTTNSPVVANLAAEKNAGNIKYYDVWDKGLFLRSLGIKLEYKVISNKLMPYSLKDVAIKLLQDAREQGLSVEIKNSIDAVGGVVIVVGSRND